MTTSSVSAGPGAVDAATEKLCIDVVRGLAMDAPRAANSGHTGTAMALAPLAYVLWTKVMRHDPTDPLWPDRDRFVLSNGHASILLYSMLHLTGYGLTLDDLRAFRQWGSLTPGHPEHGHTVGVEVTTGPLGQGVANGVGFGVAERMLRARFGPELCDHFTFVFCGDGCLMEGISHEAASLAGHLGLGRLVYVYDDNHITIDGPTELTYDDNVEERFAAYGWHVANLGEEANDTAALEAALRGAMAVEDRPSLLVLRSHIGWPSPERTDSNKAHGDPFDPDDIRATKEILGLPPDETFWVPHEVDEVYRRCIPRGRALRQEWLARVAAVPSDRRRSWEEAWLARGTPGWEDSLPSFEPGGDKVATRRALNACINACFADLHSLVVGAADLTENTGVQLDAARIETAKVQSAQEPGGRQIFFGIREHAMGGVMTGMALHGGVLPVGGTFLVFSDYMRGSLRLASLSRAHVVYSFTHDSVGLGEDGPTHQPIEHLASLRAIPGLTVVRPADANECAAAFRCAMEAEGPVALVLSRQALPVLPEVAPLARAGLPRGAYRLDRPDDAPGAEGDGARRGPAGPAIVLIGTGSEVSLCLDAARQLADEGVGAAVVSMPCWEWFAAQDDAYRDSVLPPGVPRLAVEAGASLGWERWADDSVSIDRFGASAPGPVVLDRFGFNPSNVAARARSLLAARSAPAAPAARAPRGGGD